ncbi:hypothetical protein G3A39_40340, partial [Paraburkholderia aspalathi]|nr:hypothetical protein [Paraburkholderia aspalathi]
HAFHHIVDRVCDANDQGRDRQALQPMHDLQADETSTNNNNLMLFLHNLPRFILRLLGITIVATEWLIKLVLLSSNNFKGGGASCRLKPDSK